MTEQVAQALPTIIPMRSPLFDRTGGVTVNEKDRGIHEILGVPARHVVASAEEGVAKNAVFEGELVTIVMSCEMGPTQYQNLVWIHTSGNEYVTRRAQDAFEAHGYTRPE